MTDRQPTIARRALANRIRRLRTARGESTKDLGEVIARKKQTIIRIEKGEQSPDTLQLDRFCSHFGVNQEERSHLHSLAVRGGERGWWEDYFDSGKQEPINPAIPLFLETEQIASEIFSLEESVIPGLLQTPEYLHEIQSALIPQPTDVIERARALRAHRQKHIYNRSGADAPTMIFMIGAGAMTYLEAMPPEVREGQKNQLLTIAELPNVEIRVNTQIHAASAGAFTVLHPQDNGGPIVYIESVDGCRYIESRELVSMYKLVFDTAKTNAVTIEEYVTND